MKYLCLSLLLLLFSCGGGSSENTSETETSSEESKPASKSSCLADMSDPAQWYSTAKVAALTQVAEADIEESVFDRMNSIQFNWASDRKYTMKVGNNEMELPSNNVIAVFIKPLDEAIEKASKRYKRTYTYEEYFDSHYGGISKEDRKQIDKAIDQKEEEGELKEKEAETAKSLMDMAPTEGQTEVSDLGDKANKYVQLAPGLRETRLAVLHGNVVISINADISADDEEDLSTAVAVAREVMGLCD